LSFLNILLNINSKIKNPVNQIATNSLIHLPHIFLIPGRFLSVALASFCGGIFHQQQAIPIRWWSGCPKKMAA
jgi:hypothetical protein